MEPLLAELFSALSVCGTVYVANAADTVVE